MNVKTACYQIVYNSLHVVWTVLILYVCVCPLCVVCILYWVYTMCTMHSVYYTIRSVYYIIHTVFSTHCAHCDLQCTVVWSIVCRWNKTPPLPPQEEIHTCKVLRRGASFSRKKNSSQQNCPSLIKWPRHQSRRHKTKSTLAKLYMGRLNFFQDI